MPSAEWITKPCSVASSSPAVRSASRTPSLRRGPLDDRGGALVAPASKASPIATRSSGPSGRPLRGADGHPRQDEILERGGQRHGRELATRRQQFLGDQRTTGRPLDDDDEDARRRPLAFDRFDEPRELVAPERPQRQARRWPRGLLQGRDVVRPRVHSPDRVALVGADDREPLRPGDPGQEAQEGPSAGVGAVEVLDDEEHGPELAEPSNDTEHAFEEARLAPLGDRRLRTLAPPLAEARGQLGQEADELDGRGARDLLELGVGERRERRPERADERAVGPIRSRAVGAAADDEHRLLERADPPDRLIDEARGADAGRALDQQRARIPGRRRLEHGGEPSERVLASHEPRAREPFGHRTILGADAASEHRHTYRRRQDASTTLRA
jgi:hypothetical protein